MPVYVHISILVTMKSNCNVCVVVIPRMPGNWEESGRDGAGPHHASHSTWDASLHVTLSLWQRPCCRKCRVEGTLQRD